MKRFYIDAEFHESIGTGIVPISFAIVADSGESLYMVNEDFMWGEAREVEADESFHWLTEHVLPHLDDFVPVYRPHAHMGQEVRDFIVRSAGAADAQLWAYHGAYDFVVYSQLFGRMVDIPREIPSFCYELKQLADDLHIVTRPYRAQFGSEHNALADARWAAAYFDHMMGVVAKLSGL